MSAPVAVITGAAQGIGYACAEAFAAAGYCIVVSDYSADKGAEAAEALRAAGHQARFVRTDVRQREEVDQLMAEAVTAYGSIDVLIANAAVIHGADFLELSEADFDRVIATNLKGTFLCGQAAARVMVKQPLRGKTRGAIVNMSSVNGVLAIPNQIPYVVSKGAVNQLTKVMALALAPHAIRVNAVGPGTILTEMARNAVLGNREAERKILSRTPMGRMGEPEEIASVALFLASEGASYITGQTVYADGGRLGLNYTVAVPD